MCTRRIWFSSSDKSQICAEKFWEYWLIVTRIKLWYSVRCTWSCLICSSSGEVCQLKLEMKWVWLDVSVCCGFVLKETEWAASTVGILERVSLVNRMGWVRRFVSWNVKIDDVWVKQCMSIEIEEMLEEGSGGIACECEHMGVIIWRVVSECLVSVYQHA